MKIINPFKCLGSWIGMIVGFFIAFFVVKGVYVLFNLPILFPCGGIPPGIAPGGCWRAIAFSNLIYFAITGFFLGWGLHLFLRYIKNWYLFS